MRRRALARFSLAALAAVLAAALAFPVPSHALDLYAGGEADSEDQSYYYLGASETAPLGGGLELVGRLFAGRLAYKYMDAGEPAEAEADTLSLSAGLRRGYSNIALTGYAGVDIRKTERDPSAAARETETETGANVMAELYAWGRDNASFSAIASYGTIDEFFWARVRAKRGVAGLPGGRVLVAGGEALAMGNSDFSAMAAGAVVEVLNPATAFSVLVKGGFRDSSSLGGSVYAGVELYRGF